MLDEPAKGLAHHFRATSVQLGNVNVGALFLRIQVANGLQAGGKLLELAHIADTLMACNSVEDTRIVIGVSGGEWVNVNGLVMLKETVTVLVTVIPGDFR